MQDLTVMFEGESSQVTLSPSHIARLTDDLPSWWNVLRVLAGHGDFAVMTVRATQGDEEVEKSMAVHFERPPWNWEFPETA